MRMREFIRSNRETIDRLIDDQCCVVPSTATCYCELSGTTHRHEPIKRNDEERKQWIMNDQGLYE